jgi:hypothetical protein
MRSEGFWFKSELFEIEPDEDLETNPGCYGKRLSYWLLSQLESRGYSMEGVIPEDWGWCVMCNRGTFWLWVGCGAVHPEFKSGLIPRWDQISWHAFAVTEVPFWKVWVRFAKRSEIRDARLELHKTIEEILQSEPRIKMVAEP